MNRSYQNTPNKPPGFIHPNPDQNQQHQNRSDATDYTSDFLAFSEPQASPQFKPAYYSSPQSRFHRGSPRTYPRNNRRYQRWSGNRSGNSSNYSSFNQSNSSWREDEDDHIAKFIHPSFLEDPWAHLEAELKEKSQNNESDESRNSIEEA